jgi:hypothetical protein
MDLTRSTEDIVRDFLSLMPVAPSISQMNELREILSKCNTHLSELIAAEVKRNNAEGFSNSGIVLLNIKEAQFTEPRYVSAFYIFLSSFCSGKFEVTLNENGILIDRKAGNLTIDWKSVSMVICLPSSTSSKKEGESLLILILSTAALFNNKPISALCWNLKHSGNNISTQYGPVHFSGESPLIY